MGTRMDDAKQKYRQLALLLHPDKGGSEEQFVNLTALYDLLQDADKTANAAHTETLAARRSAQHAQVETARARHELNSNIHTLNARLAANTIAVQSQYARWHHEQLAVALAQAAGKHASELAGAKLRIQQLEQQHTIQEKYVEEAAKMRSKRKRFDDSDDPLGKFFAATVDGPSVDTERERLREWEAKLAEEKRSQHALVNEWRAGASVMDHPT